MALHFQISKFLIYEAQLLDEHRYPEWLTLFDKEVSYKIPVQRNTLRRRRNAGEPEHAPIEMAHYDDNRTLLEMRVAQLESGQNWAEEPRSRSRHFITNIRVKLMDAATQLYEVRSNFLVTRSRGESEHDQWEGERFDHIRLRQATDTPRSAVVTSPADQFTIVARLAVLDLNVVRSKNLSIFF